MLFILSRTIKYYTKRGLKLAVIALITLIAVLIIFGNKFKPIYKVSISGVELGYVNNKDEIDRKLADIIDNSGKEVAFVIDENLPIFEKVLNAENIETANDTILETITTTPVVAYKTYAIVLDDEEKEVVNSKEQATEIIEEIKNEIDEEYHLTLGLREVYTYNSDLDKLPELTLAKATIEDDVNQKIEVIGSTVNGIRLIKPIDGIITSRYGAISSIRTMAHTGLDIAADTGTPIKASASGKVIKAEYSGNYGNLVIIQHENGVQTYYAHCSEVYVQQGDEVEQGDVISAVGSTGNSTGPHLHLEIRINGSHVNPQQYLYK